jgi:hypothetical protein
MRFRRCSMSSRRRRLFALRVAVRAGHVACRGASRWSCADRSAAITGELGLRTTSLPEAPSVTLTLDVDQETDSRWIAEITGLPGVLAYGRTAGQSPA